MAESMVIAALASGAAGFGAGRAEFEGVKQRLKEGLEARLPNLPPEVANWIPGAPKNEVLQYAVQALQKTLLYVSDPEAVAALQSLIEAFGMIV